jgi:hypothetical protein
LCTDLLLVPVSVFVVLDGVIEFCCMWSSGLPCNFCLLV